MASASQAVWVNMASASPAYDGLPWADDFWRSERVRYQRPWAEYQPFTVWTSPVWHGRYVNVDDTEMGHLRRTVNEPTPSCEAQEKVKVWVFGGSTTWGMTDPDWGTVPSFLSKFLNSGEGICVEVTNLGVPAYVLNQEVISLLLQLKADRRPDIAIFYDGGNDAYVGAVSPALPWAHHDFFSIREAIQGHRLLVLLLDHSGLFYVVRTTVNRIRGKPTVAIVGGDLDAKAKATLQNYEANIRLVRALAAAYRFRPFFFWQPLLYYGEKPMVAFERAIVENPFLVDFLTPETGEATIRAVRAVYAEAERRAQSSGEFTFLGHAFDREREPLYVDGAHLSPRGNELVARIIAEKIRPYIPPKTSRRVMRNHRATADWRPPSPAVPRRRELRQGGVQEATKSLLAQNHVVVATNALPIQCLCKRMREAGEPPGHHRRPQ